MSDEQAPTTEAVQPPPEQPEKHQPTEAEMIVRKMAFIEGEFLDSKAVPEKPGVTLTVAELCRKNVYRPTGDAEEKWVLFFQEFPRHKEDDPATKQRPGRWKRGDIKYGMVLGAKCNRKTAMARLGDSSKEWVGKTLRLYTDPTIKFGPKTVGGIRIA